MLLGQGAPGQAGLLEPWANLGGGWQDGSFKSVKRQYRGLFGEGGHLTSLDCGKGIRELLYLIWLTSLRGSKSEVKLNRKSAQPERASKKVRMSNGYTVFYTEIGPRHGLARYNYLTTGGRGQFPLLIVHFPLIVISSSRSPQEGAVGLKTCQSLWKKKGNEVSRPPPRRGGDVQPKQLCG